MQVLDTISNFVNGKDFFFYHGYGLTFIWIFASTLGILLKKVNIYLHALIFFLVDFSTLFLVGGAIYRYLPRFATAGEWTLVKQIHIFGGIFVLLLIILQHVGGAQALMTEAKKNPQHKKFGFWVANLARVIVVFGWLLNGDQTNILYASIASAVLLIASFYNAFLSKKHSSQIKQQVKNPKSSLNNTQNIKTKQQQSKSSSTTFNKKTKQA